MKHHNVADIPFNASNVFQLNEPDNYSCRVWSYDKGHSILVIRALSRDKEEELFIVFEGVNYYQGAMWWKGANFATSTVDIYVDIKVKVHGKENEALREWLKTQNEDIAIPESVFIIKQENYDVVIMASKASIHDKLKYTINIVE